MNIRGGGLTDVKEFQSEEMRTFRGGMRHVQLHSRHMVYGTKNSLRNMHDIQSYGRGWIQHSRSPFNQQFNFGQFYGGIQKYIFERLFYQHIYRVYIRVFWFPALLGYTLGCAGMRMYENNIYDFYYFSE